MHGGILSVGIKCHFFELNNYPAPVFLRSCMLHSTGVVSVKLIKVVVDTLGQSYFKNPVNRDRSVRKFMETVLSHVVPFVDIPNLQNCEARPASMAQDGEAILAMIDRWASLHGFPADLVLSKFKCNQSVNQMWHFYLQIYSFILLM